MNDIARATDDQQTTALLALDISAAFDTVDFDILLQRIYTDFGVGGSAELAAVVHHRSNTVRRGRLCSVHTSFQSVGRAARQCPRAAVFCHVHITNQQYRCST